MCENSASLNNVSRWMRSTLSIIALCLMATFLLSACDEGPQPTVATPVPTGGLVPTVAHTPRPPVSPTPLSRPTVTVGPTVQAVADEAPSTNGRATPSAKGTDLADLASGNSAFAFELYKNLAAEDGNLFFSPYSISLALAMTYAGARGETELQMADTLRFLLPQDRLHPAFNALDLRLASRGEGTLGNDSGGFQLNIANALWGQRGYEFLEAFLDALAQNYGAGVRPVDFAEAPEESRVTINDWVANQTEDRVRDLIPPDVIDHTTRLVLTNAIYFKATWLHPFLESETRMGAFHLLDGGKVEVPMMSRIAWLGYASGEGYQAVDLPYVGKELSMTILLPDEGRFREFEDSVDADLVGRIIDDIEERNVLLTMPRFEFESEFRLDETLKEMGMPNAFSGDADFSGMDGPGSSLVIGAVLHKAFVSVDEEGTEATAASGVGMKDSGPITVTADRPFLFLIQDRATHTILFLGRMELPGEGSAASAAPTTDN